jgi:hypothetical protein
VLKNPEFYADFRSEEFISKKMHRKLDLKHHFFYWGQADFKKNQFVGILQI